MHLASPVQRHRWTTKSYRPGSMSDLPPTSTVITDLADIYDHLGGVLQSNTGRLLTGPRGAAECVEHNVPLSSEQIAVIASSSPVDAEAASMCFGMRVKYRNRIQQINVTDIVDQRVHLVESARRKAFDWLYHGGPHDLDADIGRQFLEMTLSLQLWYVPKSMSVLVDHAATTLPNWTLRHEDMPASGGWIVFEEPYESPSCETDVDAPYWVNAVSWGIIEGDDETYVRFDDWAANVALDGSGTWDWTPSGTHTWFCGYDVHDFTRTRLQAGTQTAGFQAQTENARRRIASLWALAATPRVIDHTPADLDRPTRRRAQRSGVPSDLVIIDIRRPEPADSTPTGDHDVAWSHRWIVSGHWRNQPHGPGRELRRPTWIAPHIKGPDDKDLIIKPHIGVIRPDSH